METPSSARTVTRSLVSAASKNTSMSNGKEEPETVLSRSRKGKIDRSALVDITNDSPIVGVAMETLDTPSSVAKSSAPHKRTPGSGEALLRGQVKNLLQKIEEGTEVSKVPFEQGPFPRFLDLSPPLGILAPTPANTPLTEDSNGTQVVIDEMKQQEALEALASMENPITRALLFDSPGKLDVSVSSAFSSVIRYEGSSASIDEDSSSIWSVQANASSHGDEEEEGEVIKEDSEDAGDEEVEGYEGGDIDELCGGLSRICVEEREILQFMGRHTRFIYNSDDEIEGEEEVGPTISPGVLRLKGIPTPEGKHLRFNEEEEE